jgi:hypothetical protein
MGYWLLLWGGIIQCVPCNCDNVLVCCAPHLSFSHSRFIYQSSLLWLQQRPSSQAGSNLFNAKKFYFHQLWRVIGQDGILESAFFLKFSVIYEWLWENISFFLVSVSAKFRIISGSLVQEIPLTNITTNFTPSPFWGEWLNVWTKCLNQDT